MHRDPSCGCCGAWAQHLTRAGFPVRVAETANLNAVKRRLGVPDDLFSCHTAEVGGYVVEGHVPVGVLNKLLAERPKIKGISLPGMPDGSPGMTGIKREPFTVYEFSDGPEEGPPKIYAVE